MIRQKTGDLAPGGFQVWGIPSGAEQVLKDMGTGDHLLLLESDHFRYAGRVVHRISVPCWDLSRHIWEEQRFPLIVLLQGRMIAYPWTSFVEHLGFDPKYHMRGNTMRLAPGRVAASPSGSEEAFMAMLLPKPLGGGGAAGEDWTPSQMAAATDAYFAMLRMQVDRQPFQKSTFIATVEEATGRSEASVQYRFRNISAILDEMNLAWIDGFKPAINGKTRLLREVVDAYLAAHQGFADRLEPVRVAAPDVPASLADAFTDAPPRSPEEPASAPPKPSGKPVKRDRAASDARNRKLGERGEEWVLRIERRRLTDEGRVDLAERVRWTARDEGDGAGYDVASFNADGSPRLVEVKTTNGPAETPFYVTANEIRVSTERTEHYWLYRVYAFAKEPRIYRLKGSLKSDALTLEPAVYRATR